MASTASGSSEELPQQEEGGKGKEPLIPELQIEVIKQLVASHYPKINLHGLDDLKIMIRRLINDSKVVDKENDSVRQMVEDAIWSTAVIRPVFTFKHHGRSKLAVESIYNFSLYKDRIRHLELSFDKIKCDPSLKRGLRNRVVKSIWETAKAMSSIKVHFPRIKSLTVEIFIDTSELSDKDSQSGAWWEINTCIFQTPTEVWGPAHLWPDFIDLRTLDEQDKSLRVLVADLLEAARADGPGHKKLFKLLVNHRINDEPWDFVDSRGEIALPWLWRCDEIDFSDEDVDVNDVIQKAWDSRR
jgi:hypothetical protein